MDFYTKLETALTSTNSSTKELIVDDLIEYLRQNTPQAEGFVPKVQQTPSYASFCKIVSPKELPKRGDVRSKEGLVALVHSIAHIEYSAIDLAMDAVYRFPFMPQDYKLDWLIVAQDEIRHFKMLLRLLETLDAHYGSLPVHKSLFEMAFKTHGSAIERMAVIPRYFEASGLDVNPKIIQKLQPHRKRAHIEELISVLETIYTEEIEHVKKGDKWFKYLCEKEKCDPSMRYLEIIKKFNLKAHATQFNIEGRKEAGFNCEELTGLGAKKCDGE